MIYKNAIKLLVGLVLFVSCSTTPAVSGYVQDKYEDPGHTEIVYVGCGFSLTGNGFSCTGLEPKITYIPDKYYLIINDHKYEVGFSTYRQYNEGDYYTNE